MIKDKNIVENDLVPLEFFLSQNYPNPFKKITTIKYCVAYKTKILLTVFDSELVEIEELVDEEKKAGTYEVEWLAGDKPSGVYFYKLTAGDFTEVKKMLLFK